MYTSNLQQSLMNIPVNEIQRRFGTYRRTHVEPILISRQKGDQICYTKGGILTFAFDVLMNARLGPKMRLEPRL